MVVDAVQIDGDRLHEAGRVVRLGKVDLRLRDGRRPPALSPARPSSRGLRMRGAADRLQRGTDDQRQAKSEHACWRFRDG